jgi:hypothetical protein
MACTGKLCIHIHTVLSNTTLSYLFLLFLMLHVSVSVNHHQVFSTDPQKQGKILFVRSLKYCNIYIYNYSKIAILIIFNILSVIMSSLYFLGGGGWIFWVASSYSNGNEVLSMLQFYCDIYLVIFERSPK